MVELVLGAFLVALLFAAVLTAVCVVLVFLVRVFLECALLEMLTLTDELEALVAAFAAEALFVAVFVLLDAELFDVAE